MDASRGCEAAGTGADNRARLFWYDEGAWDESETRRATKKKKKVEPALR